MAKNYFKGWYFKCCSGNKTIAFIPAYHCSDNHKTASLQIITDENAFNIPLDFLRYCEAPLSVRSENCAFSQKGIRLNICGKNIKVHGTLKFGIPAPIGYDIMGPFQFVPFMQCRHSVYSMKHRVDGRIEVNGQQYIFKNGTGYIEGDCGYSFPKRYIWTQCVFKTGSLMLSVADIPMLGFHFNGIIGIVMHNGREYRIATYLGAQVKYMGNNTVAVTQGHFQLTAKLIKKNEQPLFAPNKGRMSETIHESVSCTAYYCFSYKNKTLLEFSSGRASFEFEY